MGKNTYNSLADAQVSALATQVNSIIKTQAAAYGVSIPQAAALNTAALAFPTNLSDVEAKKAAWRSSVQAKDTERNVTIDAIASIAQTVYANTAVTPAMIAALGLQPRATTRTRVTPVAPTTLLATPFANGDVTLQWSRSTNPYGVVYLIETSPDGVAWTQIFSTTRTRLTMSDFDPGVPIWFRVKATKNDVVSGPSNSSSIYAPGGGQVQLKVA